MGTALQNNDHPVRLLDMPDQTVPVYHPETLEIFYPIRRTEIQYHSRLYDIIAILSGSYPSTTLIFFGYYIQDWQFGAHRKWFGFVRLFFR